MKLLSLRADHFRGIRKAKLEFGAGLNVLYGPNDLGKSSLATAIRAALLMQASSRECEEFISWHGGAEPQVELVFESEPQRIWRVRKTFGGASLSLLDESRDGVDFHNFKRGRDVDGQLSEILQWGLAPPGGGKKRPRGMPATFLSTVLLAEQDRVGAIFDQALSDDSDESGKQRLIKALQAAAEHPLYKKVLDQVQQRVDVAFTSKGNERRGKDSIWKKLNEEILSKTEEVRQCREQLQKTESIEAEIRELRDRQLACHDAVLAANANLERLEAAHSQNQRRAEILGCLQESREAMAGITAVFRRLDESEQLRTKCQRGVETFTKTESAARKAIADAAQRAQLAKEEVARLQSEDRARERQLRQETLQKRSAELRERQAQIDAGLARVERVRRADGRVNELGREAAKLEAAAAALEPQHRRALQAVDDAKHDERDMQSIGHWLRCADARSKLAEAEAKLAQVEAWREAAREKRAAAASLEAQGSGANLLTPAHLQNLQKLDQDLQLARAGLKVGVEVSVRAQGKLRLSVSGDDGAWVTHELDGALFETAADRAVALALENIAEIVISGGSAAARRTAAGLQARWAAEVEPVLERVGALNVDGLARKIEMDAERARRVREGLAEGAQLEQRAADQPDWASLRQERQAELASAAEGLDGLDESALEKLARAQVIAGVADAVKRLAALQVETGRKTAAERKLSEDLARAVAARESNREALALARAELSDAQTGIEGGWEPAQRTLLAERASIDGELKTALAQLAAVTSDDGKALTEAQRALAQAEAKRAEAEAAHEKSAEDLREAGKLLAGAEAQLVLRREDAARCDEPGARAAVARVEAELAQVPPPRQPVTAEDLAAAASQVQQAAAALERIQAELQAKRGALQQVGGDVAKQHAADAQAALQAAREKEQSIETDNAAWALLRDTLRDAEKEEGAHLGRALGGPIAQRFGELTHGKYGEIKLGPNLDAPSISSAGAPRDLKALSVGTRDQLSTIFRLTLGEHLHSAVLLDDQLTQTDIDRMVSLRDLIREVTGHIQVIVFTCRPQDYLFPEELHGAALGTAVRVTDLVKVIERGGAGGFAAGA